jgi:hypothetical protein
MSKWWKGQIPKDKAWRSWRLRSTHEDLGSKDSAQSPNLSPLQDVPTPSKSVQLPQRLPLAPETLHPKTSFTLLEKNPTMLPMLSHRYLPVEGQNQTTPVPSAAPPSATRSANSTLRTFTLTTAAGPCQVAS